MPHLYIGTKPDVTIHNRQIVKFSGSDYKSITAKIQRTVKQNGINISLDDIQRIVQASKREIKPELIRAPVHFNVYNFCPCILKIVYETAICIFGEKYIEDECGCKILQFLNDLMNRRYTDNKNEIMMQCQILGLDVARKEHFIQVVYNQDAKTIDAIISIFGCFIFIVTVSNNPAQYSPVRLPVMRFETI